MRLEEAIVVPTQRLSEVFCGTVAARRLKASIVRCDDGGRARSPVNAVTRAAAFRQTPARPAPSWRTS